MTASGVVRHDVVEGVAWLTLENPQRRNAMSRSMAEVFRSRLLELATDRSLCGLVISGDETAFCSGVDLAGDDAIADQQPLPSLLELLIEEIRWFPLPTVALVRGHCLGMGCAMATACDVRFVHPAATFGVPGARLGIQYPSGSLRRLVDLVGPGRANLMLLSGRRIDGRTAASWGLADVCGEQVVDDLGAYLDVLRQIDPAIVQATREVIRGRSLYDPASDWDRRG